MDNMIRDESTISLVIQHQHQNHGYWMDWYSFDDLDGDPEKRAKEYLVSRRFATPGVNWRLVRKITKITEEVIA